MSAEDLKNNIYYSITIHKNIKKLSLHVVCNDLIRGALSIDINPHKELEIFISDIKQPVCSFNINQEQFNKMLLFGNLVRSRFNADKQRDNKDGKESG